MIRVLAPGLLSTIQDLGRPGYAHAGVSAAGAADPLSLRAGNRLLGNPDTAPAVEMTLQGGAYLFEERHAWVAIAGGDFDCSHPMWQPVRIEKGETVKIGGCRSGARAYLCVRGGIEVPRILGSASTHLLSGFGAALKKGDRLGIGSEPAAAAVRLDKPIAPPVYRKEFRVTPGAQARHFSAETAFAFLSAPFRVREDSNRMGIRLEGAKLAPPFHGQMISEGVALGAIQVPPGGDPVILFVDAQTTGGYPVIACIITADVASAGQLRPRDDVRFVPVSFDEARQALEQQEAWLDQLRVPR